MDLHVALHLLAPGSDAEEEPQRYDANVERAGRHPGLDHVQLPLAQIVGRGGVGRPPERGGEQLHVADVRLLRLLGQAADVHVLDHPLTDRGGLLLLHRNLLSDGGKGPNRQLRQASTKEERSEGRERQPQAPCRGAASSYRPLRRSSRTAADGAGRPLTGSAHSSRGSEAFDFCSLWPLVPDFEVISLTNGKHVQFQWIDKLSTKLAQSTGQENNGPERRLPAIPEAGPVNSLTRITLENNGKIRPKPDRENAVARASGGGRGTDR
jgi:hypothetical protein